MNHIFYHEPQFRTINLERLQMHFRTNYLIDFSFLEILLCIAIQSNIWRKFLRSSFKACLGLFGPFFCGGENKPFSICIEIQV